jgi:peptidylprolyl isomerase
MKSRLNLLTCVGALSALAFSAIAATNPPATSPAAAAPSEADWRTPDPNNLIVIDTNKGRIIVELWPSIAPASAAQVRQLAHEGFYNGRAFFRVIDDFMDQTGDPKDNGEGGSTKPDIPAEFVFRRDASAPMVVVDSTDTRESGFLWQAPVISQKTALAELTADHKVNAMADFCPGVVGMARAQDPASGNSQFFLMRAAQAHLDGQYTAVGRVVSGLDVVRQIKTGEPVAAPQDKMLTVRVLADMPAAGRPIVRVIDTTGPWFAAQIAHVRAEKVVGASPCDLDIPSQVK